MGTIDFTDSIYDAQQGSQSAIKFIYDNTIQLFYKEACVFMRDRREADIAVRDAYSFIFNHLDSLEDSSKFLLWANEVCKNTCISRLKQAGVFNERIPAEAANIGEITPSSEYDPLINENASMPPNHVQACLDAILNSLPDNQRACAILWGEGYPVRSMSRKLGISTSAVNYTLAYALGNISNSVTTLGNNGLPLYSMEPIPYFLWLLISYYQYYRPEGLENLAYSSFSGVLRTIIPDEASIYSSEYSASYEEEITQEDGRVQHITQYEEKVNIAPESGLNFAQSLDLNEFINDGDNAPAAAGSQPVPEMEIYPAHPEEEEKEAADAEGDSIFDNVPKEHDTTENNEESKKDTESEDGESSEDADSEDAESDDKKDLAAIPAATEAAADLAGDDAAADDAAKAGEAAEPGSSEPADTGNRPELSEFDKPKKKHTGLIIALIIIIIILALLGAALIFGGKVLQSKLNSLLGTNLFNVTENSSEDLEELSSEDIQEETTPEEETTTPETTTAPETTTPETTTEEETTTEAEGSLPYDVQIYADGIALGMRAVAGGDDSQPRLTYIPSDTRVTIDQVQDGWGHTYYSDEAGSYDGWIWLGFTKVVENAPIEKPLEDQMLETPENLTTDHATELRTGPGTFYSTFGPVPQGSQITIEAYDYSGSWAYTSYGGHHGWISLYN